MEQHPPISLGGEQEPLHQTEQLVPDSHPLENHRPGAGEQVAQPSAAETLAPDAPESVLSALAITVPAEAVDRDTSEPTTERRTNKQTLAVAKASIEAVAEQVRENENMPGVRDLAEHFITSDSMQAPPHILYRATAGDRLDIREVMATVTDGAIFRLWSRSKVVYAMDDLLLGYLSEASSSPIPTQILEQLPHPDPFVLLPKPDLNDPLTAYYSTRINLPVGAFVFGRYNQAQQLTSTADAKREDLGLMFVGFRDTDHGPDLITLRCTIPLQGPSFRVEDAVNATIAKFRFNEHLAEDDPAKLEAWLRTYVGQAFNSLLYVCTEQPDIEVYEPRAGRRGKPTKRQDRRRPRSDDIDTIVKLGFRMGPALHQARTRWERSQPAQPGSATGGRRVRPHQKKGHYRTYWTGPGRELPILKWISPFWVNETLLGEATGPKDVVVRPVRRRE
jgi:hypothetical protein